MPIKAGHLPVLMALDPNALLVGGLVAATGFSQPGISRIVDRLVDLGLVTSDLGEDRRNRIVSLTSSGEALIYELKAAIFPGMAAANDQLVCRLSGTLFNQIRTLDERLGQVNTTAKSSPW